MSIQVIGDGFPRVTTHCPVPDPENPLFKDAVRDARELAVKMGEGWEGVVSYEAAVAGVNRLPLGWSHAAEFSSGAVTVGRVHSCYGGNSYLGIMFGCYDTFTWGADGEDPRDVFTRTIRKGIEYLQKEQVRLDGIRVGMDFLLNHPGVRKP